MQKILKRMRKKLELVLARLGLVTLPFLPRRLILALARMAGVIGFYCVPAQRRLTMTNLEIAFGQSKSADEKKRIALKAFQTMALVFLDYFWFARRTTERVEKYVTLDQSVADYFPAPPALIATAHFGNWEVMGRSVIASGRAHFAVAAPSSNPDVDALVDDFRLAGNAEIIAVQGALRKVVNALRQGKCVALLLDQNTKPKDGGIFVDFFGLPIPMSSSVAILAERFNVPITPTFCRAQPDGHYVVYSRPLIRTVSSTSEGPDPILSLTQKIASVFQKEIEESPEQWMWMYKRWKHIKSGRSNADYPYYAKPLQ
ncbi:MAG: hypothetical protein Q7J98_13825 [Kiritimatiellia bacterium]|nr:hypothetical protein [Kiritimatiellia bacterium]